MRRNHQEKTSVEVGDWLSGKLQTTIEFCANVTGTGLQTEGIK